MVVTFKHRGDFKNVEKFMKGFNKSHLVSILNSYGAQGVAALASATPIDSGVSASSWSYRTSVSGGSFFIIWENSSVTSSGTPIVILLQYGHGTGTGGYVQGRDFINPAIKPVMDKIAEDVWREVTAT